MYICTQFQLSLKFCLCFDKLKLFDSHGSWPHRHAPGAVFSQLFTSSYCSVFLLLSLSALHYLHDCSFCLRSTLTTPITLISCLWSVSLSVLWFCSVSITFQFAYCALSTALHVISEKAEDMHYCVLLMMCRLLIVHSANPSSGMVGVCRNSSLHVLKLHKYSLLDVVPIHIAL